MDEDKSGRVISGANSSTVTVCVTWTKPSLYTVSSADSTVNVDCAVTVAEASDTMMATAITAIVILSQAFMLSLLSN